jgi:hypothetical protein
MAMTLASSTKHKRAEDDQGNQEERRTQRNKERGREERNMENFKSKIYSGKAPNSGSRSPYNQFEVYKGRNTKQKSFFVEQTSESIQ